MPVFTEMAMEEGVSWMRFYGVREIGYMAALNQTPLLGQNTVMAQHVQIV